jgi:hypothetical protein
MVRKPSPISLRLGSIDRARGMLARLEREETHRRRIRYQAIRASLAFDEVLTRMSDGERERWRAEAETVRSFLKRLQDRGA